MTIHLTSSHLSSLFFAHFLRSLTLTLALSSLPAMSFDSDDCVCLGSLFDEIRDDTLRPPPNDHGEWTVERILFDRQRDGGWEYMVKWFGYPVCEATWEPASKLYRSRECVLAYWARVVAGRRY